MSSTFIHPTAVVGENFRRYQFSSPSDLEYRETEIGQNVYIGAHVVVGRGCHIGDNVVIDHQCILEPNATIRANALIIYRSIVGGDAIIGPGCVIGGFVAERCTIGEGSRFFGTLVHHQHDTTVPWDEFETPEPSASLGAFSFVGFGAVIVGGVIIGERSYVCSNAIVTKDVPPLHVAHGKNCFIPVSDWKGPLSRNPVFHGKSPVTDRRV